VGRPHKVNGGGLHGDVGTRAHGDPDIRRRKSWRIIDAVADPAGAVPFRLKSAHFVRFLARKNACLDAMDATCVATEEAVRLVSSVSKMVSMPIS